MAKGRCPFDVKTTIMPASMQGIHVYIINVGSMLARPELVGMQEPRIVGQARVKFPHLFLCR
jgi:hypothetical protein